MTTRDEWRWTDERGQEQHVEVVEPGGTGGGFHVYVNRFFHGQIVRTIHGWKHYINSPALTADDIDAIMDKVNEMRPWDF